MKEEAFRRQFVLGLGAHNFDRIRNISRKEVSFDWSVSASVSTKSIPTTKPNVEKNLKRFVRNGLLENGKEVSLKHWVRMAWLSLSRNSIVEPFCCARSDRMSTPQKEWRTNGFSFAFVPWTMRTMMMHKRFIIIVSLLKLRFSGQIFFSSSVGDCLPRVNTWNLVSLRYML